MERCWSSKLGYLGEKAKKEITDFPQVAFFLFFFFLPAPALLAAMPLVVAGSVIKRPIERKSFRGNPRENPEESCFDGGSFRTIRQVNIYGFFTTCFPEPLGLYLSLQRKRIGTRRNFQESNGHKNLFPTNYSLPWPERSSRARRLRICSINYGVTELVRALRLRMRLNWMKTVRLLNSPGRSLNPTMCPGELRRSKSRNMPVTPWVLHLVSLFIGHGSGNMLRYSFD
jgi:hypothetical protein